MGGITPNPDVALNYDYWGRTLVFAMANGDEVEIGKIESYRVITSTMVANPKFHSWHEDHGSDDNNQFVILYYYEPMEYQLDWVEKAFFAPIKMFLFTISNMPIFHLIYDKFFKPHHVEFYILVDKSKLRERGNEVYIDGVKSYKQKMIEPHESYWDEKGHNIKVTYVQLEFLPEVEVAKLARRLKECERLIRTYVIEVSTKRKENALLRKQLSMYEEGVKTVTTDKIFQQEKNYAEIDKLGDTDTEPE
mgnify:CR=1 FL=1